MKYGVVEAHAVYAATVRGHDQPIDATVFDESNVPDPAYPLPYAVIDRRSRHTECLDTSRDPTKTGTLHEPQHLLLLRPLSLRRP